jgi:phage protein D
MSDKDMARRTELKVIFEGVDISVDIRKYLNSLTYTDNEEDKTDDLQIAVDDRDNIWLGSWLNTPAQPEPPAPSTATGTGWNVGDEVTVTGRPQYSSYGSGTPGAMLTNYKGKITRLNLKSGVPYPIHVDQKGWFAENQIAKDEAFESKDTGSGGAKGATMQAAIIQKNWTGDGKDKVLDCGLFEVDSVDASGPPQKVTLKGTSIPYTSTARTQKKTKAWEKIKLSGIANEIAAANGLKCMFESANDPLYTRKEQVQESDIVFLQRLCKDAGISLKVTAKMIVLFDEAVYEQKAAVRTIKKGSNDVISYSFATNMNDTAYSSCHVSYTDPATGKVIEYTYTPQDSDKSGQVLEINEKVSTREEARQLAMKRLRQKNKSEYTANFTLVGDVLLVAGVTVNVSGYGMFDGKYIIEQAIHTVSSGYKVSIKLHRVLEGY